ncbi:hypothetical protein MTZ49_01025 [Entomomonas sp. E2T0]|uniref:hypothetical protein n=1 Tax=Entomomonas sp. E2T0 TaxID=2930213 RepID=UPI0022283115|nr:hypothetical protein [Entomomonas sp. E2T0]UYZ84198.1 hypothetical protein MTZ49_01025 [Entomomonas sp. E2T0]
MLQVTTTSSHQNEGIFPTFPKGTRVTIKESCEEFVDWYLCEIDGYTTYISKYLLEDNELVIDYNPTELDINKNENLEVISIYGAWLYAKDIKNQHYG